MTYASTPATDGGLSRGWAIALGAVLVILGLVALMNFVDATLVTTVIVGWVMVFAGVAWLVAGFMTAPRTEAASA